MKKVFTFILVLVASISLVACDNDTKVEGIDPVEFSSLGTQITLIATDEPSEKKNEAIEKSFKEIRELFDLIHNLTDNFEDHKGFNGLYHINENTETKILIDPMLYDMLKLSDDLRKLTDGYFDVSIGLIIDEWKSLLEKSNPTKEDLILVEEKVSKIDVIEDAYLLEKSNDKHYITLKQGAKLDLGALAKGYAVEKASLIMKKNNIISYQIKGSDSSVHYGTNNHKSRDYYNVGLNAPQGYKGPLYYGQYFEVVKAKDISLTTSGDTIQNNVIDGRTIHHIISPKTKRPENYRKVVTLFHEDATLGDALSTAIMSMPVDYFNEWFKDNKLEIIFVNENNYSQSFLSSEFIGDRK